MTQLLWDGLFVGSFYALVALGYSMVYGIVRLLNFAHGDLYMLGAFVGFVALSAVGGLTAVTSLGALALALVVAMTATGTAGLLIERVAYRPLRGSPRLAVLITAVGASFTLEYGIAATAGTRPRVFPVRLESQSLEVLGVRLTVAQVLLMLFAVGLMLGLDAWVGRTSTGRAMRAIALDPRAAHLMGINVDAIISRTFFVGASLAGAAGVMAGAYYGKIDFLMGFVIGLKAFTAAVIGGIGNLRGAMLGGLLLGLAESLGAHYLGGQWRDVCTFVLLIAFLSVRPTGLLGERVTERV
ncbi:branched-chain amino acid ABC transporter permease [Nocardioides sp. MH1]|uniref:branched-chain amino acid ABC transporter permease n=1 Tax=Nocardioides sp. MH1 TaxID=3242490 RepID=UPI00351F9F15